LPRPGHNCPCSLFGVAGVEDLSVVKSNGLIRKIKKKNCKTVERKHSAQQNEEETRGVSRKRLLGQKSPARRIGHKPPRSTLCQERTRDKIVNASAMPGIKTSEHNIIWGNLQRGSGEKEKDVQGPLCPVGNCPKSPVHEDQGGKWNL